MIYPCADVLMRFKIKFGSSKKLSSLCSVLYTRTHVHVPLSNRTHNHQFVRSVSRICVVEFQVYEVATIYVEIVTEHWTYLTVLSYIPHPSLTVGRLLSPHRCTWKLSSSQRLEKWTSISAYSHYLLACNQINVLVFNWLLRLWGTRRWNNRPDLWISNQFQSTKEVRPAVAVSQS